VSVEDDAKERPAAGEIVGAEDAAAVGELRVVGKDGADAGEDGVGGVAEELNLLSGSGAGEPVRLIGEARGGWGSKFAVDGERGLEGDKGSFVLDEVGEGFVEVAGLLLEDAECDFNVGGAESLDALATDMGVGVLRGDDAAGDAGFDECVGTGWGAAVVAAGFEGDVGGGAPGGDVALSGLLEGDDLGVVAVVVEVGAFADDYGCFSLMGLADEDTANLGVG